MIGAKGWIATLAWALLACTSPKAVPKSADVQVNPDVSDVAEDAIATDVPNETIQGKVLPPPGPQGLALKSGDAWLNFLPGETSPALMWKDPVGSKLDFIPFRAILDLTKLRFGRVPTFDPTRNYDPAALLTDPLDVLQWLHVAKATFEPHVVPASSPTFAPGQGVTIRLQTQDDKAGAGPDYLLEIDAADLGRFRCDLHLADAKLREQAAHDQMPQPIVYLGISAFVFNDESYYGLGEFPDTPQHRGKIRDIQLEPDLNLDGSSNEGHVRVPLLVGTRGWGLFVESRRPMRMDVAATHNDQIETLVNDAGVRFWLLAAEKPRDVPGLYTRLTGAPVLPATWAFGGLIWRNENDSQQEVLDDMAMIRKEDLALSGMWLDRPFDVAVNDFGFDPKKFPDAKAMVAAVHALGFRMGEWSTPYLDPGPKNPKAKHHDAAEQQGFFVKTMVGTGESKLQQWGPPIDFTKSGATAFWKSLIKQAADAGIEGWKLDYGEDIQLGILGARFNYGFADGSDERTMHHGYMPLYHQPYAESLPKTGGFLLCRAGTYGDQALTSIVWPGDLCANWTKFGDCDEHGCHAGGLPVAVSEAISLATSGYPLFGSDTGGYRHGRASKELFLRWLGHTALSGILQIGGGSQHNPWDFKKYAGNPYGESQFDQETLDVARELIRLHTRLFPYLYTDAWKANKHEGIGPIRALGMMHPELALHPGLHEHEADEYYLGDFLLVAPVLTPGGKREVWLPPGEWRDWWTHEVVGLAGQATTIQVDAPLGQPPLYVRSGAILAMLRPTIDTLAPSSHPGVESFANDTGRLYVTIVPGAGVQTVEAKLFDATLLSQINDAVGLLVGAVQVGTTFQKGLQFDVWWQQRPKAVRTRTYPSDPETDVVEATSEAVFATCQSCWLHDAAAGIVRVRVPAPPPGAGSDGKTVNIHIVPDKAP